MGDSRICTPNQFLGDAARGSDNYTYSVSQQSGILFCGFPILFISLEFDEMKQNHTHKTLGEQNFILKIDLRS